jgi:hypothetical protein
VGGQKAAIMTDEKPPTAQDEKEESGPRLETGLRFTTGLLAPRGFPWTRIVLYGAVVSAGLFWFFWRTATPSQPREVFRHADRIRELEWPDSGTRLVSGAQGWEVFHPSWERAAADPTAVLTLLDRLRNARGIPLRRLPPDFRPAGRLVVATPEARRTLVWHTAGADAIVESGGRLFLVPGFPVGQLFPAPENLVSRRILQQDPATAEELSIIVVTADGERRYRIRREGDYWYIPGTHAHLLHTPTVTRLLRELQELSFRRLLPAPATWPSLADFAFTREGASWRLARVPGDCPEGELAVARLDERWLAGCVSARAWSRLVPTLPALLEPRLVPPPEGGGTWDRIELRHRGSTTVRVTRTEKGWTFEDGTLADAALCAGLIEAWGVATVLGLEPLPPTDSPELQVILHRGAHAFSVHLMADGDAHFAVRQGERRRARIPKVLFDLVRADAAWWRDRRVFPHDDVVKIQRSAGDFRETWAKQDDGAWRILEPLDQPYLPGLATEVIPRLLSLRHGWTDPTGTAAPTGTVTPPPESPPNPPAPSGSVPSPELHARRPVVAWTLTRADGSRIELRVSPDGPAARTDGTGTHLPLHLDRDDVDFLLRPFFLPHRPAWDPGAASALILRLADGRTYELQSRDPNWLWTSPDGKKILLAGQVAAYLARLGQALDGARELDLGTLPECPIRLTLRSDVGVEQGFCLEAVAGHLLISRAGLTGRSLLAPAFLELLTRP